MCRFFALFRFGPGSSKRARVYIGTGFEERNDAFYFWAALVDVVDRIKNDNKPVVETSGPDLTHLQLRDGQTFSLGGSGNANNQTGGRFFKLKPPPRN